jgi:hypothetical protein
VCNRLIIIVFSNGGKKLGLIGQTIQTVNKADSYFDSKYHKVGTASDDGAVNGTRTEPIERVSNDDHSFADRFKDQLAYYAANNIETDDAPADP